MRFEGRAHSPAGPDVHVRLTIRPASTGRVLEKAEVSDDGRTWRDHHDAWYVRSPSSGEAGTARSP